MRDLQSKDDVQHAMTSNGHVARPQHKSEKVWAFKGKEASKRRGCRVYTEVRDESDPREIAARLDHKFARAPFLPGGLNEDGTLGSRSERPRIPCPLTRCVI